MTIFLTVSMSGIRSSFLENEYDSKSDASYKLTFSVFLCGPLIELYNLKFYFTEQGRSEYLVDSCTRRGRVVITSD